MVSALEKFAAIAAEEAAKAKAEGKAVEPPKAKRGRPAKPAPTIAPAAPAPVAPAPAPPAKKLEMPKGALQRLGPSASVTIAPKGMAPVLSKAPPIPTAPAAPVAPPVPKADIRTLDKVPPAEAGAYEERLKRMALNDIDALLSLELRTPWQNELIKTELERRRAEQLQKKYANKPVIEILLDAGQVPHNLIRKEPAWASGSKEIIDEGVRGIDPRVIRALSDYYNRLEKMSDLNDNEKYAAEAMRKRIWDEEIGTYSVDEMPLLPDDMDKLRDTEVKLIDGSVVNPLDLSNRELAEAVYVKEGGGATFGEFKGGPFDKESSQQSSVIDDIKVRFEGSAYTAKNPAAIVKRIETALSGKALLKRLLFGGTVSIKEIKERKGKAELIEAEAMAYMPPIYEELKQYYKPDFKAMDISDAKEQLFKMKPDELHKTYQLYYIMKSKNMLDKKEEALEEEMKLLLEKFEEMHAISGIHTPRTSPPPKITEDDFKKYLETVNTLFGELPEEAVKELMTRPDESRLYWVLTTGIANEQEKKHFVKAMDDIMIDSLSSEKMEAFFKTPEGKLYYKMIQRYGEE